MKHRILALIFLAIPLVAHAQVELVVQLREDADPALHASLGEGGAKRDAFPALFEGVTAVQPVFPIRPAGKRGDAFGRTYTLALPDSNTLNGLLARWQAQSGVSLAQPNHRYALDGAGDGMGDPLRDSLSHFDVIRLPEAWLLTSGDPSIRIGQIDTGLFLEHPDFAGQVWVNPGEDLNGNGIADPADFDGVDDDGNGLVDDIHGFDFVDRPGFVEQGDFLVRDTDPSEDNRPGGGRGHGTTVAGVLVAARDNGEGIAGVAPGARLVPLRAFGADGQGDDDDIAAAIVYAADMGLDVVNLSFGDVFYSTLMHEAIRYAVARGTVVVASAGNVGGDDPHYPSDYPEVISVAWLNEEGTGIASRGTHGLGIELGAPGSFVFTTLLPAGGEDTLLYGRRSGSSLAAPMVTATVALLRSLKPDLTPAAIRSILTASARDIGEAGWDHRTGAGLLDVATALSRALPARAEITAPEHNAGLSEDRIFIVGTAVDPSFASYALSYTPGDTDLTDVWTPIAEGVSRQVLRDTLGVWDVSALPEGIYTLRLALTLRTGRTVEDRRRVFIDRSPPVVTLRIFEPGLVDGEEGLVGDLQTDDLTTVRMEVELGGQAFLVDSDRLARRHGLAWADASGAGGTASVRLHVRNGAGLETTMTAQATIPPARRNTALFDEEVLSVPHGFLLPRATDFDHDGLLEMTFNRYQDGWLGDTLATYEWAGEGFRVAQRLLANVFPRDVGDSDGDGLLEILTQVGGATLVLEQPDARSFPFETAFLDTTGLGNPFAENAAFGARITDLDGDGRAEILVHNTVAWRVLEYDGNGFSEVARLENPTAVTESELDRNEFQEPEALVADFDGDGRSELLVGDSDGDWILYEADGDNAFRVAATVETPRYNAGSRFARGDFDGDGLDEFVTYTQNWTQATRDNEREPDIGRYFFWKSVGGDAFTGTGSFSVAGRLSRHGSMTTADFDGDGRDELVLAHPPHLYVLTLDPALGWTVIYRRPYTGDDAGIRSIEMVTGDFDGDGTPEVVAAGADERMHRFIYRPAHSRTPPPQWTAAVARDARHLALSWQAPGADSVTVFGAAPGASFDPIGTTIAGALIVESAGVLRVALRGWFEGVPSPLSPSRLVRPHDPAIVLDVAYPDPGGVVLRFSAPLSPLSAGQFRLDGGGAPDGVVVATGGTRVALRFKTPPVGPDTLRWEGVTDAEGTPVGQQAVALRFPDKGPGSLYVKAWAILAATALELTFSEALDPAFATDVTNYRIAPAGQVASVDFDAGAPERVTLHIPGVVLGATGLETSVEVLRMQTPEGNTLASEGTAIRLVQAAEDLRNVYVFPNPYREGIHRPQVMIAGLPANATVELLSVQGSVIRVLEEQDGDGGLAWDLKDEAGRVVPSGVYLVRVSAPEQKPVMRKAAIIR